MSYRHLTKRCCLETLYRDRWQRLTTKILAKGTRVSCSGCRRCPYKGILHSIFRRNPAEEILRTIFHWYLHKGNLQNLPWHLFVMFFATLFGAFVLWNVDFFPFLSMRSPGFVLPCNVLRIQARTGLPLGRKLLVLLTSSLSVSSKMVLTKWSNL